MTGYNKWRARADLLQSTISSAGAAAARAVQQEAVVGPGINFLHYPPGSGLSMLDVGSAIERSLRATGRPLEHFEVAVSRSVASSSQRRSMLHRSTVALVQSGHVPSAALQLPRLFAPTRFRVAVVHYELPQVPRAQRLAVPFVDELWTTSDFVQDAFSRVTRKPVRVVPLALDAPEGVPGAMRTELGLGEEYLFGFMFDLASSGERKNPAAVARAYLCAFPTPRPDVRLLLKAVNASMSPAIWTELGRMVSGRPDVILLDEHWPSTLVNSFFLDIDCYVSMHRAEGFGLTLANSMAAGKPVIATGYSGNASYMSSSTSVLLPWKTVTVGPNPIYPPDGTWAEPDLDTACDAMRAMALDPAAGKALGERARAHVLSQFSKRNAAAWLHDHLPA